MRARLRGWRHRWWPQSWNDKFRKLSRVRKVIVAASVLLAAFYFWICGSLLLFRFVDPPTTAVQMERRVESWFTSGPYRKQQQRVGLDRISRHLQHAVVAAEDTRFFDHPGIDLEEWKETAEDAAEGKRVRGASTITQQLLKNLFFTTRGSIFRKAAEIATVPPAEWILGKERILEIYLNVIEWGPGIYGAEAASRHYYGVPAAKIGREQAARMAAVIPAPRRRSPQRMDSYAAVILRRMGQMGW